MNLYVGTLGQLVLVELFVFYIWFRVLFEAIRKKQSTLGDRKLLMTSLGLVFNSGAIVGIMIVRILQLSEGQWPFVWAIILCYVLLGIGGILFIISAAIGNKLTLLKMFLGASAVWTGWVFYSIYF